MGRKAWFMALLTGGVGTLLLHIHLERLEAEIGGGQKLPILVAARDAPLGAVLDETMLGLREVPQAYVEARHIRARDAERVLGSRVSLGLQAGEALLWTDVAAAHAEGRDLASLIREGMRAVAIQASAGSFDELLRPGDRVDALFTSDPRWDAESKTVTLLQNVMVLAVGNDLGTEGTPAPAVRYKQRVTLGLNAEQTQLLVQAESRGKLRLVLRNPEDIVIQEGLQATTLEDLRDRKFSTRWRTRPTPPPATRIDHVR